MSDRTEKETLAAIERTIMDLQELRDVYRTAVGLQWGRPHGISDPDDPGIRSRGGFADPTGDTATDEARLYLRKMVRQTEVDSLKMRAASTGMVSRLKMGLRRYDHD